MFSKGKKEVVRCFLTKKKEQHVATPNLKSSPTPITINIFFVYFSFSAASAFVRCTVPNG